MLPNNRRNSGQHGQATLELTLAVIALFVLMVGTARIFMWFNHNMVERQRLFQQTRASGLMEDFNYTPTILRVLPSEDGRDDIACTFPEGKVWSHSNEPQAIDLDR